MNPVQKKQENLFKQAVKATLPIASCYQEGLQALLAPDRKKIVPKDSRHCQGSIHLDECLKEAYPQSSRWDYALGYQNKAYFIEVHPACAGEVKAVLKKLDWLNEWLRTSAPELLQLEAKNGKIWIASGKQQITPTMPQYKKAAKAGLLLQKVLKLP